MMHAPVLAGVPDLEIVVLQWSRKHGECQECGLPAAFRTLNAAPPGRPDTSRNLCAVCAANFAADGETIMRIEELE